MQRRAFTVTELLVVMGIIIGIAATLMVGLTAASRAARKGNTQFLMDSMAAALAKMKVDTGYIPPVLGVPNQVVTGATSTAFNTRGWGRDLVASPTIPVGGAAGSHWVGWTNVQRDTIQRYRSATTLAEYLIGSGDRSEDGYGAILDASGALPASTTTGGRENPPVGIRAPGADGVWGALLNPKSGQPGNGLFASRNLALGATTGNTDVSGYMGGKPLGPYLELKDRELLGALVGFQADGTPLVAKPGDSNYSTLAPKVILDYFGKPILYYRRGYPNADPRATDPNWSLADVYALRPWNFGPNDAVNGLPDTQSDQSTSRELRSASFAMLSLGPDQRWNPDVRRDTAGYNEDNIVKTGGE